jgi:succinyl-CoA synthetase alpha subunit
MTILADENTRVIVGIIEGITGRIGAVQTRLMLDYGTKIVAGVTPGKEGQTVEGVAVYDSVTDAADRYSADASIIFVQAASARDAAFEAIAAGIGLIVIVTERIPIHDALKIGSLAKKMHATVIGPNTPGIISPGRTKIGIMPGNLFKAGHVGVVARSATLSYEIAGNLTEAGIGQSTCVGIGGDRVTGVTLLDVLKFFQDDEQTHAVVVVGEVGRTVEEELAEYVRAGNFKKPVISFIAGRSAPEGRRLGHAGAIIEGGRGTAQSKIRALRDAGISVADRPSDVPEIVKRLMR